MTASDYHIVSQVKTKAKKAVDRGSQGKYCQILGRLQLEVQSLMTQVERGKEFRSEKARKNLY